jgi:hypothetical protein
MGLKEWKIKKGLRMKINEEKIINDSDIMKTIIKKIDENVFKIEQILKSDNSSDQVFLNSYDLKEILSCFKI